MSHSNAVNDTPNVIPACVCGFVLQSDSGYFMEACCSHEPSGVHVCYVARSWNSVIERCDVDVDASGDTPNDAHTMLVRARELASATEEVLVHQSRVVEGVSPEREGMSSGHAITPTIPEVECSE